VLEGGAQAVIEAIAAHTPVIASRIDGNISGARARTTRHVRGGRCTRRRTPGERAAREPGLSAHARAAVSAAGKPVSQPAREAAAVNALVDNVLRQAHEDPTMNAPEQPRLD